MPPSDPTAPSHQSDLTGPSHPTAPSDPTAPSVRARAVLDAARADAVARLASLTGGYAELVAASRDSNADDEHDPEGATIAFERSQLDSLVTRTRIQLVELDAALERVDRGDYGRCEACGRTIAPARLDALPAARTCIDCAARGRGTGGG